MALANKTYKDLKDAVALWLNRDDDAVTAVIPSFIELAEQEFSRQVKIPLDEGSFLYLNPFFSGNVERGFNIPDDCLSPIGVWVSKWNGSEREQPKSYTRIDGFAYFDILNRNHDLPLADQEKGTYFCKYQNQFLFYPELQPGDAANMTYHKDLVPMSADSDTSPCLKYGYDLMLYWSLKHASVYLRDPEQEAYWDQKAQEAALTMEKTFNEQHWAGSPLVILNV